MLDDVPARRRVPAEVAEEAVERRSDRVEAGDEEQEADVEDLLVAQPITLDLGFEERAHEVVVPGTGALGEQVLEVRVDLVGRRLLECLGLGMAARFSRDVIRPDDAILHRNEARQLVEREPEHRQEHLRWERHRELLREVDLVVVHERIDQLVGEVRGAPFERGHALRREQRVEELPILPVVGRIRLQRDQRATVLQISEPRREVRREDVGVAKDVFDGRA